LEQRLSDLAYTAAGRAPEQRPAKQKTPLVPIYVGIDRAELELREVGHGGCSWLYDSP
jgi:hypothetical protein